MIAGLCRTGLFAWEPGCAPVQIASSMIVCGRYPDFLLFNARTGIVKLDGVCVSSVRNPALGFPAQDEVAAFDAYLDIIKKHEGKYALFRHEAVAYLISEWTTSGQPEPNKPNASEKRAMHFRPISDKDLLNLTQRQAHKYLEDCGDFCSQETARRALAAAKRLRGLPLTTKD
ncbi:MAG: hypothetical protein AAF530_25440 [Pseudomonadota bacterium]